jgi:hypothetical protein
MLTDVTSARLPQTAQDGFRHDFNWDHHRPDDGFHDSSFLKWLHQMAGNVGYLSLRIKGISRFLCAIVIVVQPVPKGPRVVPVKLRMFFFSLFFLFLKILMSLLRIFGIL